VQAGCTALLSFRNAVALLQNTNLVTAADRPAVPGFLPPLAIPQSAAHHTPS